MSTNVYTTLRGVQQTERPMADLNEEERAQILRDWLAIGSKATAEKWNIKRQTIEHIKWHYRPVLEAIEDEHFKAHGL